MPGLELSAAGEEILPSLATTPAQLPYLAGNMDSGGMALGTTASRSELTIELVRAAPTRLALMCEDPWLARLLTIRVAGLGANTVIATDRAAQWEYFVNAIGGQRAIATVRTDHGSALPAPSVGSPLVVIEDARDVPPETYAPRMAWQTTIHVRASINERSRSLVDASHVVLMCRLPAEAAAAASTTLGLGDNGPATVAGLHDNEVLVIADRRAHRIVVTPTATERRML